jgi:hypothetical protein
MNMAESLNLGCLCSTLRPDLLRAGLHVPGTESDWPWDLRTLRPHLFSATPVFISAHDHSMISRTVAALHRIAALPEYRAAALARATSIALGEFGPEGAFMGYDFHLGAEGPRLIEINTNAGGALLHAAAARAHRSCCSSVDRMFSGSVDLDRFDAVVFEMFQSEWRAQRGAAPMRSVVIVDDDPREQYLALEFELARQLFLTRGIAAVIADPRELEWRDGQLWHDGLPEGLPVDLVYNRLTDFDLSEDRHTALRQAYTDGAAVVTPHPGAHAVHADKRNLVALADDALLASWGASGEDRAIVRKGVPSAQRVSAVNADALWAQRRQWFFKPACGYGSKAAYRGDKLTRRVWGEILAGDFVAQALVPPSERLVNVAGEPTRLKLDIRAYAYAGHIQLLAARTYSGQTTNFRTAGGGFSPVVILPDLASRPISSSHDPRRPRSLSAQFGAPHAGARKPTRTWYEAGLAETSAGTAARQKRGS